MNGLKQTSQIRSDFEQAHHIIEWYYLHLQCIRINKQTQQQSPSTTSIMDLQLLCQKICQKISVIKTDTSDDITKIVHFGILIHVLSCRQQKHNCLF